MTTIDRSPSAKAARRQQRTREMRQAALTVDARAHAILRVLAEQGPMTAPRAATAARQTYQRTWSRLRRAERVDLVRCEPAPPGTPGSAEWLWSITDVGRGFLLAVRK